MGFENPFEREVFRRDGMKSLAFRPLQADSAARSPRAFRTFGAAVQISLEGLDLISNSLIANPLGARSNRLSWGSDPMRLRSSHRVGAEGGGA